MLTVSELYIYPIKSLGGIQLPSAVITDRGFEYDRRWMLIDDNNIFLSQREWPQMALLQCSIDGEFLTISHKVTNERFVFHVNETLEQTIRATVWDDTCTVREVSHHASQWFSDMLRMHCRLVYMPDDSHRPVDARYAHGHELTSLSDAYPLLVIGQASLDELNERLEEKLPVDRFRPNIVFTGGAPHTEDYMKHFRIGDIDLFGVKPCARCTVPTINQQTAMQSKEPLKTLSTYRMSNNQVFFGMNVVYSGTGVISEGDTIEVISKESILIHH